MEQSIVTWNIPNFVTVVLMVALGMVLFTFIGKAVQSQG
jgi:hypothetical protein